VSRRLLAVKGVGAVNRVGGVTREVRVALDPQKLQALGATAADISRQLRQVQTESAGGRTDLGVASNRCARWAPSKQRRKSVAGNRAADGRTIRSGPWPP
jgi:multidrug efflux pump subunit AcrB